MSNALLSTQPFTGQVALKKNRFLPDRLENRPQDMMLAALMLDYCGLSKSEIYRDVLRRHETFDAQVAVAIPLPDYWMPILQLEVNRQIPKALEAAKNFLSYYEDISSSTDACLNSICLTRVEWPTQVNVPGSASLRPAPAIRMSDTALAFAVSHDLLESLRWLKTAVPQFFVGADFEIDLLQAQEDDEDDMISLRVYAAFEMSEFRENRHRICRAMLDAGHKSLSEVISIFQRRTRGRGWQELSWYGTASQE
jgi:hypothetical protein